MTKKPEKNELPAPLSDEEVKKESAAIDEMKTEITMDAVQVAKNLTEWLETTDPIIVDGKVRMWCRRPTMEQLEAMVPPELRQYKDKPTEVPKELEEKYKDDIYKKLAELIEIPKHTTEEWKKIANPWLIKAFQEHLFKAFEGLGVSLENF